MKRFHTHLAAFAAVLFAGAVLAPSTAEATLVFEPVFDRVGEGVADLELGIFSPGVLNFFPEDEVQSTPSEGEPFLTANAPGEVVTYALGSEPDPLLDPAPNPGPVDFVAIENNTDFAITGWTLTIVGPATVDSDNSDPDLFNFEVNRGFVDAIWGGGVSDIFGTIEVSPDGKTITFSDGLIPVGGLFTDYILPPIFNDPNDPDSLAVGIDASFEGVRAVPEPPTLALLGIGLLALLVARRRRTLVGRGV